MLSQTGVRLPGTSPATMKTNFEMKNKMPTLLKQEPLQNPLSISPGDASCPDRLPTFVGVRRLFGYLEAACFEVALPDGRVLHLSAELPSDDDVYAVVLVDAKRFLSLWRSPLSSHRDIATMDETTWPSDHKFLDAVAGFDCGRDNPVPLAEVSCSRMTNDVVRKRRRFWLWNETVIVARAGEPYLGFTNGVTRTIFMLAGGVSAFPVKCAVSSAKLLWELADVEAYPSVLLSDLAKYHA